MNGQSGLFFVLTRKLMLQDILGRTLVQQVAWPVRSPVESSGRYGGEGFCYSSEFETGSRAYEDPEPLEADGPRSSWRLSERRLLG